MVGLFWVLRLLVLVDIVIRGYCFYVVRYDTVNEAFYIYYL